VHHFYIAFLHKLILLLSRFSPTTQRLQLPVIYGPVKTLAFMGTVAFWIDDNWDLNECVLELLLLSGDHSGKASGKLIFKALRCRGIETKLSKPSIFTPSRG